MSFLIKQGEKKEDHAIFSSAQQDSRCSPPSPWPPPPPPPSAPRISAAFPVLHLPLRSAGRPFPRMLAALHASGKPQGSRPPFPFQDLLFAAVIRLRLEGDGRRGEMKWSFVVFPVPKFVPRLRIKIMCGWGTAILPFSEHLGDRHMTLFLLMFGASVLL